MGIPICTPVLITRRQESCREEKGDKETPQCLLRGTAGTPTAPVHLSYSTFSETWQPRLSKYSSRFLILHQWGWSKIIASKTELTAGWEQLRHSQTSASSKDAVLSHKHCERISKAWTQQGEGNVLSPEALPGPLTKHRTKLPRA